MDETTKSIWNKTPSEMTVKDNLVMAAVTPAIAVGGVVVAGVAAIVVAGVYTKFQERREARKNKTTEES